MSWQRWLLVVGFGCVFVSGGICSHFIAERGYAALRPTKKLVVDSSLVRWQLRSKHLPYGVPVLMDARYSSGPGGAESGVSVLVREGFVIGHFDRGKIPLWMSMRWTKADLVASLEEKERRRRFDADDELPEEARGSPDYNRAGFDRGHLARSKDNSAWGEDNALTGDRMSNVVPQLATLNRGPWLELEKVVSSASEKKLALSDTFWIIAGPIFEGGAVRETIGNGIGVPDGFFKIVTWTDRDRKFQAMAFIFPKHATVKNPTSYLSSVDEVERRTGIDFFPDLESSVADDAEAFAPKRMWEMSR